MRTEKRRIRLEEIQEAIKRQGTLSTESQEKPEPIQFKCRICGSEEYQGVYVTTGFERLGSTVHPTAFQCKGCSIMFGDPVLFSKRVISKTPVPVETKE